MLEDLVSQFKLKAVSYGSSSLPPARKPAAAPLPPPVSENVYEPTGGGDFGKY
jgi:hypothetical protein